MKKLKILKRELLFQFILSILAVLVSVYVTIAEDDLTALILILITLFIIGLSNIIGFLIRITQVSSKLNVIYGVAVALFLIAAYLIFKLANDFIPYIIGIGSVVFNFFYLWSGYFLITNTPLNTKCLK